MSVLRGYAWRHTPCCTSIYIVLHVCILYSACTWQGSIRPKLRSCIWVTKSLSDLVNDSEDCSGEPAKVIFISATGIGNISHDSALSSGFFEQNTSWIVKYVAHVVYHLHSFYCSFVHSLTHLSQYRDAIMFWWTLLLRILRVLTGSQRKDRNN